MGWTAGNSTPDENREGLTFGWPGVARIRATADDSRSQLAVSSSSCLRPVAVSRQYLARRPLSDAPQFGSDPVLMFQAVESGVERSLLRLKRILRNLLNALRDSPAVPGVQGQRFHC